MPKTTFLPEVHGFAFQNSFALSDDERTKLIQRLNLAIDTTLVMLGPAGLAMRLVGVRDRLQGFVANAVPSGYGLCGGMAFAALDYFHSGIATPRGTDENDQPPPGSPLRTYLGDRLIQSWEPNGLTFLEWIARLVLVPPRWPFNGGPRALRDRTRDAWSALRGKLDAGVPTPLGLVGEATDPFQDHQVVAYDYAQTSERAGTIFVYDMNCPGAGRTIEIDLGPDVLWSRESCPRPGNALRGFFCEQYQARTPPNLG